MNMQPTFKVVEKVGYWGVCVPFMVFAGIIMLVPGLLAMFFNYWCDDYAKRQHERRSREWHERNPWASNGD